MRQYKWVLILLISLTIVQFCSISLASTANASFSSDDWTMFRHDPEHSGYVTGKNSVDSPKLVWIYNADRMVQTSPAVANGYVYIGSRDAHVFCLNASNGDRLWWRKFDKEVWSSPAIYNGQVIFGVDDGYVYSLNFTTGAVVWKSFLGGTFRSSPVIADGRVYIGSGDHDVFALDTSNGTVLWSYPTLYSVWSSPAVSNGMVYIAAGDYNLTALDATTGKQIWSIHTGAVYSSPSVYNGYVYIGSVDGYVYSLNASTGAIIWDFVTQDAVCSCPAVAYGRVYIGSEDNNVYCLNASTGEEMWHSPTGYWVESSPAVADGNVYVGSFDYNIYCFDAYTGEKKWSYAIGNFIESSPTVTNGMLYFGSDDFHIYAFALNGSNVETFNLPSTNYLAWTTIVFDAVAGTIVIVTVFSVARFVRSAWRSKSKTASNGASGKVQSWFFAHMDAAFILAILAFSAIYFVNLGSGPLWFADERTYSQWAFHMVKNGDYLNPWACGEPTLYISKPPLNMWLMSLAYQIFGINNFSTRISSAVFGALSLIVVYYLGKKLYNSYVGFLSAIVLGTFTTFFLFARHAMTDVPLLFFILASLYFFLLSEENKKPNYYAVLSGLFFGLAFMTKQIQALLIPLILITYFIATKRSHRFLFTKRFTLFWGVALLIFVPWLLYMHQSFGADFWQFYFVDSGFARTITTVEGHFGDFLFYFSYLATKENLLWVILLPFAVGLCAYNSVKKRLQADTLILLWTAIILTVFTIIQTKLEWYIVPVLPAFAIAISSFLYQLSRKIRATRNSKNT